MKNAEVPVRGLRRIKLDRGRGKWAVLQAGRQNSPAVELTGDDFFGVVERDTLPMPVRVMAGNPLRRIGQEPFRTVGSGNFNDDQGHAITSTIGSAAGTAYSRQ